MSTQQSGGEHGHSDGSNRIPCGCQIIILASLVFVGWVIFRPGPDQTGHIARASAVYKDFQKNEVAAADKWEGKQVRVRGRIEDIKDTDGYSRVWLYLDGKWLWDGVACGFDPAQRSVVSTLKVGDTVVVMGRIVGRGDGGAVLLDADSVE